MKSKSGNKKLWIAVIIFVLMIAGAIGNHSDNKKEKPDRESSVAAEAQTETETESNTEPGVIRRILLPRESSVIPIRQIAVPPDRCRCIS